MGQMFVLNALFENVFLPNGLQNYISENQNLKMFGIYKFYHGFTHLHMQIRCNKQFE